MLIVIIFQTSLRIYSMCSSLQNPPHDPGSMLGNRETRKNETWFLLCRLHSSKENQHVYKKCSQVIWVDMGCHGGTKDGMTSSATAMKRVGTEQCLRTHCFPCPKCTYLFSKCFSSKQLNPNPPWRCLVISALFHRISSWANSHSPWKRHCHLLENSTVPRTMLNDLHK